MSPINMTPDQKDALLAQIAGELRDARVALLLVQRLCDEALPKFDWGASALDANAIDLLNRVPNAIAQALGVAPLRANVAPKTREETARFVEQQFSYSSTYECQLEKGRHWHYGKQDVRALLDFIYDGEPATPDEHVQGKNLRNRRST